MLNFPSCTNLSLYTYFPTLNEVILSTFITWETHENGEKSELYFPQDALRWMC